MLAWAAIALLLAYVGLEFDAMHRDPEEGLGTYLPRTFAIVFGPPLAAVAVAGAQATTTLRLRWLFVICVVVSWFFTLILAPFGLGISQVPASVALTAAARKA